MTLKPKHIIEYILLQGAGCFIRFLPLSSLHKVGLWLVRIFYPVLRSRRKVAIQNLNRAFPEMDEKSRELIAFQSFQSICIAFIELLWYPRFSAADLKKRVYIENPELMYQLIQRNKGLVFLTAHFGSWELATQAISVYNDMPVLAVAKEQSNPLADRWIKRLRELFGVQIVAMDLSVREVLRTLQQKGIVALAADQSAPKESVSVEFFGSQVPTFQGPATFCLKTGAPLLFGYTVRQNDGNYVMYMAQVPSDDLRGASDDNILELTRRHVKMTEEIIRQYPEQWMWMHKRWKHAEDRSEAV